MAKPTSIDNHCYCAMPACSAEIYDHQPYVHDGGQYWHLDCWMKIYEVPIPPMLRAEREQQPLVLNETADPYEPYDEAKWRV